MFCTQCGTQVDEGNFCRNCGARLAQSSAAPASPMAKADATDPGPSAAPAAAPGVASRQAQPQPIPAAREHGDNNKLIIVAAGVGVVVLAAIGAYFGTDLMKPSVPATAPRVPEPIAKNAEAPPLPSFEETKGAADNSSASNPPVAPELPAGSQGESPKPPVELLSEPARKADLPPAPKSQDKRAGEEPLPAGRVKPPVAASRGGAGPGTYETLRTTSVHDDPSPASKVVASIPAGTRVTVVGSSGEWLEVHSKRGNPPGFIRRGDATFVESSN